MAYVKISAHRLASASPEAIETELRHLLEDLGHVETSASVSRIDLYVDFQSTLDMEGWDRHSWVTRAESVDAYSRNRKFSGWTIGLGGPIGARLYDKTLELKTSGKTWLYRLWHAAGWDSESRVWRLEFELKRDVLGQLGSTALAEVLARLGGLWQYATSDWLRLAVTNSGDATRSRWATHPLWNAVAALDWGTPPALLSRSFSPMRAPEMDWVLRQSRNLLTTFMALRGLDEYWVAFDPWNREIERELVAHSMLRGVSPNQIIEETVALKNRRFNAYLNLDTVLQEDRIRRDADDFAEEAREYRRLSRGGDDRDPD